MRHTVLVLLMLGVILSGTSFGQPDPDEERNFFRPKPRAWSMELELSSMYDSNIAWTPTAVDSNGFAAGFIFRGNKRGKGRLFRLQYRGGAQTWANTARRDSAQQELSLLFFQRVGSKLTVGAIGGYSLKAATEDFVVGNHYNLWSQVEYRPVNWARLGVYGAQRTLRPLEEDRGSEQARLLGTDIGFEIGDFSIAEVGYRIQRNDADSVYRRFDRATVRAEYAVRAGDRDRIRFRVERRERRFPERLVRVEGLRVPRQEHTWRPSALWVHDFAGGQRLELSYMYQSRASNSPGSSFSGHRLDLTVRVPLVRRVPRPGQGRRFPLPRLPEGTEISTNNNSVLDQLEVLSEREDYRPKEDSPNDVGGGGIVHGASWQEVLAARGVPSRVTERAQFFEKLWFYGSSWVVFRKGRVISWHDAGELETGPPMPRPLPQTRSPSRPDPKPVRRASRPGLVEMARNASSTAEEETASSANELPLPTISAAFQEVSQPEIVLKDGTRLKGYLQRYENGLARVVLFLPNDRTLFATLPEAAIDREATQSISSNTAP